MTGAERECSHCSVKTTPLWRKYTAPDGSVSLLCNACWVYAKRHGGLQGRPKTHGEALLTRPAGRKAHLGDEESGPAKTVKKPKAKPAVINHTPPPLMHSHAAPERGYPKQEPALSGIPPIPRLYAPNAAPMSVVPRSPMQQIQSAGDNIMHAGIKETCCHPRRSAALRCEQNMHRSIDNELRGEDASPSVSESEEVLDRFDTTDDMLAPPGLVPDAAMMPEYFPFIANPGAAPMYGGGVGVGMPMGVPPLLFDMRMMPPTAQQQSRVKYPEMPQMPFMAYDPMMQYMTMIPGLPNMSGMPEQAGLPSMLSNK